MTSVDGVSVELAIALGAVDPRRAAGSVTLCGEELASERADVVLAHVPLP